MRECVCVCAYACAFVCVFASACAFVCVRARASAFVCVRVRSCGCGCMCIRVSEAEVAWLFHQTLVCTPVWECAGVRSCANSRILLCKEPLDTRSPPKGVAGGRSLSVRDTRWISVAVLLPVHKRMNEFPSGKSPHKNVHGLQTPCGGAHHCASADAKHLQQLLGRDFAFFFEASSLAGCR